MAALVGRGVSEFPDIIVGLDRGGCSGVEFLGIIMGPDGGGCSGVLEFPGIIVGPDGGGYSRVSEFPSIIVGLDRGRCGGVLEFPDIIAEQDRGGGGGGSPVDADSGGSVGVAIVTEEEDPAWISLAKSITCALGGTGSVVLIFALFRLRLSFKFSPSPLLCFEGRAP